MRVMNLYKIYWQHFSFGLIGNQPFNVCCPTAVMQTTWAWETTCCQHHCCRAPHCILYSAAKWPAEATNGLTIIYSIAWSLPPPAEHWRQNNFFGVNHLISPLIRVEIKWFPPKWGPVGVHLRPNTPKYPCTTPTAVKYTFLYSG